MANNSIDGESAARVISLHPQLSPIHYPKLLRKNSPTWQLRRDQLHVAHSQSLNTLIPQGGHYRVLELLLQRGGARKEGGACELIRARTLDKWSLAHYAGACLKP